MASEGEEPKKRRKSKTAEEKTEKKTKASHASKVPQPHYPKNRQSSATASSSARPNNGKFAVVDQTAREAVAELGSVLKAISKGTSTADEARERYKAPIKQYNDTISDEEWSSGTFARTLDISATIDRL